MFAVSKFSKVHLAAVGFVALTALPVAEFRVQVDKENIVSNSIEGTWVSDDALNAKLGEPAKSLRLEITRDDSIATKIPEKYAEGLGKRVIYAAGIVVWKEGTAAPSRTPMMVIEFAGNPHLVTFGPRGDEPLGNAESCNVMLVRAKDRANDLLFLGGDTARESFQALHREVVAAK